MARDPEATLLQSIAKALTAVANKIATVRTQLKANATPEQVAAAQAKLTEVETRLKSIGTNPADPVPVDPAETAPPA